MKKFIVTPFAEPKEVINESQIRDMVGAPTREEEENEICLCGEPLDTCPDAYTHVTMGY